MDNEKFIKKVIAILEKQQSALKKLAQTPAPTDPPLQKVDPNAKADPAKATKRTADILLENMPPALKALVPYLEVDERRDLIKFKSAPGANQQAVKNQLEQLANGLINKNVIVRMNPLKAMPA